MRLSCIAVLPGYLPGSLALLPSRLAFTVDAVSYPMRNVQDSLDYDSLQFLTSIFGSRARSCRTAGKRF